MITIDNKQYRNLQEQVEKNKSDIEYILTEEGVLNEFGIRVTEQVSDISELPTVDEYKESHTGWEYGDCIAVGDEEPYELYILTRANGSHPNDYWFDLGVFPLPGPQGEQGIQGIQGEQGIQGPQGIQGIQGPQGERGKSFLCCTQDLSTTVGGYTTIEFPDLTNTPKVDDLVLGNNSMVGIVSTVNPTNLTCVVESLYSIKGQQGEQGIQGPQGIQGIQGVPGTDGLSIFYCTSDLATTVDYTVLTPKEDIKTQTQTIIPKFNDLVVGANGYLGYIIGLGTNSYQIKTLYKLKGEAGQNGINGTDGTDGFSPIVSITSITGGNRLQITDATHVETADIMNGSNGTNGKDGLSIYETAADLATSGSITTQISNIAVTQGRTLQVDDYILGRNGYIGYVSSISGSNVTITTSMKLKGTDGTNGTDGLNMYRANYTLNTSGSTVVPKVNVATGGRTIQTQDLVLGNNGYYGYVTNVQASNISVSTLGSLVGPQGIQGPAGQDGTNGTNGQDGFSPIITVTSATGGHEVSITDATGTETFLVSDGTSPVVTPISNGIRVTVYDEQGSHSYDIVNGQDGTNGTDGTDGVTPSITAAATVDSNTGTPTVTVTKTGTDASPTFTFAFSNLKGAQGDPGVSPTIDEDIIPKAFNTYVLGDNTHSYKEVVANKFKSPNSYYEISGVNVSGHGQVGIKTTDGNGTTEAQLQLGNTGLYTNKSIAPLSGTVNLGQAANGFNNLYLDGKIVTDDNYTYGLSLPDTTNFTADKTIATTDQITTVTANVTVPSGASNLTSLQVGSTVYNVPSGGGGSSLYVIDLGTITSFGPQTAITGTDLTKVSTNPEEVVLKFTYGSNIYYAYYRSNTSAQAYYETFVVDSTNGSYHYVIYITYSNGNCSINQNFPWAKNLVALNYAPNAANYNSTQLVVLSAEPATYYQGYIYFITEA